jgi:hypothetical protein
VSIPDHFYDRILIFAERDTPYCGGDCFATGNPALASIPAASANYFPNAKPFQVNIVTRASHGLNLEYSAPATYGTILDFLSKSGLAA